MFYVNLWTITSAKWCSVLVYIEDQDMLYGICEHMTERVLVYNCMPLLYKQPIISVIFYIQRQFRTLVVGDVVESQCVFNEGYLKQS